MYQEYMMQLDEAKLTVTRQDFMLKDGNNQINAVQKQL